MLLASYIACRRFRVSLCSRFLCIWQMPPRRRRILPFRLCLHLQKLLQLHSQIMFLAGFSAQPYDCCPDLCICYTGPHSNATSCTYCGLSRYHTNGKPCKKFTYLPLIPCLQAFCANHKILTTMQYQSQSKSIPGVIRDVFDGENYKALRSKYVQMDNTTFWTLIF